MAEKTLRKTFELEILTPEKYVVDEVVEAVVLPASNGFLGILANHAPFMGGLKIGVVKYLHQGKARWVACNEGVFEIVANKLRILADTAELGEEIDILRAQQARERAIKRIKEKEEGIVQLRAELALKRAVARLKAAEHAGKM